MRQLKEIANEILEKKFLGDEKKMARHLESGEMDIRRVIGKAPGSGRNQQKIFEFKVWWYGVGAIGVVCGWIVLAGWVVIFLFLAYIMVAMLLDIRLS